MCLTQKMPIEDFLRDYIIIDSSTRQTGKTTALAEATKRINGILITPTITHAKQYKKIHNVETNSFRSNLRGIRRPLIIDHFALNLIFQECLKRIDSLKVGK